MRISRRPPSPPPSSSPYHAPRSTNTNTPDPDDDDDQIVDVYLDDVLAYVSPAELERFELSYHDDVVVVGEDGEVLLVSREAQQAMMGAGATENTSATATVSGTASPARPKRKHKVPTQAFVDQLPPRRRRGRPKKERVEEIEVEGGIYGAWVDPANVRGTRPVVSGGERYGLALSASEPEAVPARGPGRPAKKKRSASSMAESRADALHKRLGIPHPASSARAVSTASTTSTKGARLHRSSFSSNDSDAKSFHSAAEDIEHPRSSAAPSSSSQNSPAAALLSAFHSTQSPRHARTARLVNPDPTPKAVRQAKNAGIAQRRLSTMLHPPAEAEAEAEEEAEEEEEPEEEYEIEDILSHKHFAGQTYYLVKWAHWPVDEDSWFSAEELGGASEILEDYLRGVEVGGSDGDGEGGVEMVG